MAFGIGSILSTVKDIVGVASAVAAVAAPFLAQEQAQAAPSVPQGPDLIQEQRVAAGEARDKKQQILKRKKAGQTVFTDQDALGSAIDDTTQGFGRLGAR